MSDERAPGQPGRLNVLYPPTLRAKRRHLSPAVRNGIIAMLGALVGLLAFFLVKKLGA